MQSQLLINKFTFHWLCIFPKVRSGLEPKLQYPRATRGGPYRAGRLSILLSFRTESSTLARL